LPNAFHNSLYFLFSSHGSLFSLISAQTSCWNNANTRCNYSRSMAQTVRSERGSTAGASGSGWWPEVYIRLVLILYSIKNLPVVFCETAVVGSMFVCANLHSIWQMKSSADATSV